MENEASEREDITLQEKLEKIIEARENLLKSIPGEKGLDNGYNTFNYNTNNENLSFFRGGLLNIGNTGLFVNWNNFFGRLRGDEINVRKVTVPFYYPPADPQKGWYSSYLGSRPSLTNNTIEITPKWEIITDKNSCEKLTTYLFQGRYIYQRYEGTVEGGRYYGSHPKEPEDLVELSRPVTLFFDDRGIPQLYIFSLSGSSKEILENKFDENFVIRVDDYDINYLNNLFLVLGGIYFSSLENKKKLIEIAERTGVSTFSSLIESFGKQDAEKFYNSFRLFIGRFSELKVLMSSKNVFLDKYVNILVSASKTFRQRRAAYYSVKRDDDGQFSFFPLSFEREYSMGEIKNYMPSKISIVGNKITCFYASDFLNKKDFLRVLENGNIRGKSFLTPTRKKFLNDFEKDCIQNAKNTIEIEYKNIDSFSRISEGIKNLEEDLNNFENFICKSFSSVFFLATIDK